MKLISIASTNPVKAKAAQEGFRRMFPDVNFELRQVKPGLSLPAQPSTDEETLDCAEQRAHHIRNRAPDGDYWVGIEGGVADGSIGMGTYAWVVILDREGKIGRGRTGEFFLPEKVADLVRRGVELGEADDQIFSRNNSKQANGAVGLLTSDAIDRTELYIPAVIFALIPFKHPELYP